MTHNVEQSGHNHVQIVGDAGNDLVDVCRLTCLEQGINLISVEEHPTTADYRLSDRLLNSTNSCPVQSRPRRLFHGATNPTTADYRLSDCLLNPTNSTNPGFPTLRIDGRELSLEWPDEEGK